MHRTVCALLAWSMSYAAAGVFPMKGFRDEEFDPKSFRYAMRGQPLAQGWRPMYVCVHYTGNQHMIHVGDSFVLLFGIGKVLFFLSCLAGQLTSVLGMTPKHVSSRTSLLGTTDAI